MPSTRIQTPNNKTVKKQLNGLKRKPKYLYLLTLLNPWQSYKEDFF